MAYTWSRALAGPALRLVWRPRVSGAAHVPPVGGAILASNHLSVLDSVFLPLVLKRPVVFAAKQEYFDATGALNRVRAAYFRRSGQLAVDRGNTRAAQAMLDAALEVLQRGELFGIYPEGTRSPDGRLYRGRTGVGWLALASGVPVLPVAMVATDRVLPPGARLPRVHRVGVRIGSPLTFDDLAGQAGSARARREVTDRVIQAIRDLSGQEYAAVYAPSRAAER